MLSVSFYINWYISTMVQQVALLPHSFRVRSRVLFYFICPPWPKINELIFPTACTVCIYFTTWTVSSLKWPLGLNRRIYPHKPVGGCREEQPSKPVSETHTRECQHTRQYHSLRWTTHQLYHHCVCRSTTWGLLESAWDQGPLWFPALPIERERAGFCTHIPTLRKKEPITIS